jgi:hypothetical protein
LQRKSVQKDVKTWALISKEIGVCIFKSEVWKNTRAVKVPRPLSVVSDAERPELEKILSRSPQRSQREKQ